MTIDELIASYSPLDHRFADTDNEEPGFVPNEKECDAIFGIEALRRLTTE